MAYPELLIVRTYLQRSYPAAKELPRIGILALSLRRLTSKGASLDNIGASSFVFFNGEPVSAGASGLFAGIVLVAGSAAVIMRLV